MLETQSTFSTSSRKSCLACVKGKRKCEPGFPSCKRCARLRIQCLAASRTPSQRRNSPREPNRLDSSSPGSGSIESDHASTEPEMSSIALRIATSSRFHQYLFFNQGSTLRKRLEYLYLESIVPSKYSLTSSSSPFPSSDWICEAVLAERGNGILEESIRGLYLRRLGNLFGDETFKIEGLRCFERAVRQLSVWVQDPEVVLRDETLATAKVLALYELCEATDTSSRGREVQVSGIEYLIQARGPERHRSGINASILRVTRFNTMATAIMRRKRSILGQQDWRVTTWSSFNNFQQRLYDVGFDLAALLEDLEAANVDVGTRYGDTSVPNPAELKRYLQVALALDIDVDDWYNKFTLWYPDEIYWQLPGYAELDESVDSDPYPNQSYSFTSLHLAHLMLDYWAIRLVVSSIIITLRETLQKVEPETAVATPVIDNHLQRLFHYTQEIAKGLPFVLRSDMGLLGPSRAIFSTRVALSVARRCRITTAITQLEALLHQMSERHGIKFASILIDQAGTWN